MCDEHLPLASNWPGTSELESDEDLAREVRDDPAGERGRLAASRLLARYQERVYLWCYRRVWDHDCALDLAQDVLLNAYRGLPAFRGGARFSSWLFAIARNRCLSQFRAPDWRRMEDVDLESLPGPAADPADEVTGREGEERLLALIREHLDPVEQDALWLRCSEGLPVDEITRLLGTRQASGARGVLQSARRKLRAALERRASEESGAR